LSELNKDHAMLVDLVTQDGTVVNVPTPMGEQPFKIEARLLLANGHRLKRGNIHGVTDVLEHAFAVGRILLVFAVGSWGVPEEIVTETVIRHARPDEL
jgi:hypothetical protein